MAYIQEVRTMQVSRYKSLLGRLFTTGVSLVLAGVAV